MAGILPYNEEVEASLVARLLFDSEQLPLVSQELSADDFYVADWRSAYAAMQKLSSERKRVDITTLSAALGSKYGDLGDRVMQAAAYTADVMDYIEIIKRDAFRRRVIGGLQTVITQAIQSEDREGLVASLHDTVINISTSIENSKLLNPGQAIDLYEASLKSRSTPGYGRGLFYGLKPLDDKLNPAMAGDMIVLAARPSVGKTALAENIADNWAEQAEFPILFASLEMGLEKILDRTISRKSGINAKDIVRGLMDDEQAQLAAFTAEQRRSVRLWYLDDPYATTSSVRAAAAKTKLMAGGLSGIVIDYMQLLKDPGDQEVQRVTRISRQIKAIAREFEVPLLVLSQLSRAPMAREDQHPRLSDLRESGAIEQDADVVIGLWRELGTRETDVEVLKQRGGEVGMTYLDFDSDHVRFVERPAHPVGINALSGLPNNFYVSTSGSPLA